MLSDLHIENIAVISRADVTFEKGLNVLTGETGAGKSIVIDALQCVLGARASRELVRSDAEKALVTAVFDTKAAEDWLNNNDIEDEGELILQRRVTRDGKTSGRICGVPAAAGQLKELSSMLLDLHGQNDGRQLMDESRHRVYLDLFGDHKELLAEYSAAWEELSATKKDIERLTLDLAEKDRITDSLQTMISELDAAELREGEEEELTERRNLLRNSEKLTDALARAREALLEGDTSAVTLAEEAEALTRKACTWHRELETTADSVRDACFVLRDAAETMGDLLSELDFSPEEYDRLESRLDTLRRLQRRYGGDIPQLMEKVEEARGRLEELEYSDHRLEKLEARLKTERAKTRKAAEALSSARKKAAEELKKSIERELRELSMPSVKFVVDITRLSGEEGFDSTGADKVRFLMSANRGEAPGPISRIASGGELSRIMLAMKIVFSRRDPVETMVFDEIDAGISGIAAQRVAEKLALLAAEKQVLCVTHLPQIAAMADAHFLIEKTEREDRTFTSVNRLDREGRIKELARLHGGDRITENTLKSAGEQLSAAEEYKLTVIRTGLNL